MGRLESAGITVSIAGEFPVGAIDAFEEAASRIISLLDGFAPDLVFINSLGGFIGAEVARRLGRPAVWAIHEGLPVPVFLRAAFGAGLREDVGSRFRELLAHADLAVFESEFSRRLYAPALEEASRGVCVPYGVDVAAIDRFLGARSKAQAREALGLLPDSTVVLCAGTVEPRKAQANLATAFARVKARHKDAHLVLVGDQENLYSLTLHDLVGREALRGCVRLVAVCEDPSLWYRAADIVATVGDVESLPRCLLESMAFGLPVVATDVAGVSELVENEVNGLLCRPNDLADLTRVLDQALRMGEETRQDMGRRGAGLVRDRHDAACYAPQLMEMMRRVLPEEEQR
jgi:glycosyltransferase involved in cell wall biosynthesis